MCVVSGLYRESLFLAFEALKPTSFLGSYCCAQITSSPSGPLGVRGLAWVQGLYFFPSFFVSEQGHTIPESGHPFDRWSHPDSILCILPSQEGPQSFLEHEASLGFLILQHFARKFLLIPLKIRGEGPTISFIVNLQSQLLLG